MQDDRFEWDDDKAVANFKKHHIAFEQASAVFDDPLAIERPDEDDQHDEDRYIITGKVTGLAGDKLVTVVYIEREVRTRIISARKATRREQDTYHQLSR